MPFEEFTARFKVEVKDREKAREAIENAFDGLVIGAVPVYEAEVSSETVCEADGAEEERQLSKTDVKRSTQELRYA